MIDMAVTSAELLADAEDLVQRAAMLEGFAQDRYDWAVREHGFGTLLFFRSIDIADGQRAEARRLRELARRYREAAARVRDELER